jgi:hypothetical protein
MNFPRASILLALAWAVVSTSPAHGQSSAPDSVLYTLISPPSEFQYGCFGPCACAVFVRAPLTGTFVLRRSHADPLYTWYDVIDVQWKAPDPTHSIGISGSGYYRRGGEVAVQEELSLDLRFDGGPVQHFYSGLRSPGATFPEIKTQVSIHPYMCFDSVLVVDARPANGVVGVGDDDLAFATHPNPFGVATEIRFALAESGRVSLTVFDLRGRRIRDIVRSEWITSGPHARTWDGRLEDGSEASAGLYFLRLESPAGTTNRTIVKLR